MGIVFVLTGLMARDFGGRRPAQIVAAVAASIAPVALIGGVMLHYLSFDYLWWVVVAFCMVRRLRTDDLRWWLGVGAAIGLGMMTKYTMAYFVVGVVAGVLFTPLRRDLRSRWLWAGVALSLLIFLPNLIWQIQHDFISLEFLSSIHERDIAWGRTDDFLVAQLYNSVNPFVVPLAVAGLIFCCFAPGGKRYRALGWMFVVPFVLLLLSKGRFYYIAPAYPMLIAAGVAWGEGWLRTLQPRTARWATACVIGALTIGGLLAVVLVIPIAPVNSPVWTMANDVQGLYGEMVGWQELVDTVAGIYHGLPEAERAQTAILTANYGELGAVNLYGPTAGLPPAISGINSAWERGYGDPPPETVIVLGFDSGAALRIFRNCQAAGQISNRHGVMNEETAGPTTILICRNPILPWPKMWQWLRSFG
jgi:4-amino-4-deoxy-L-arabinose transferase-like glycosyltransferase